MEACVNICEDLCLFEQRVVTKVCVGTQAGWRHEDERRQGRDASLFRCTINCLSLAEIMAEIIIF